MTRKRIRQMNAALLRRLSRRPAAEYLAGREDLVQQLVGEGYFQRFVPLMADRVSCLRRGSGPVPGGPGAAGRPGAPGGRAALLLRFCPAAAVSGEARGPVPRSRGGVFSVGFAGAAGRRAGAAGL